MVRKSKIGKQRKDRFYHLAKETGYRSRAAFKLIQLNRKFEFLQRSRVLVDLCAAPGGWLQVAQKFMPVSSVIVGVDLVPIKAIPNVITFQADITSQECRQQLKKELKTWKADVFLNDGAPNVGKNWLHDAYTQTRLTLSALQLATEFLMKGGYFVTKVFRSKDYDALMWIFGKFFRKVHATKPQASRFESAEIFVVCEKYLAPDHIDKRFFDPNYVFEEVTNENAEKRKKAMFLKKLTAEKLEKKNKAVGYDGGVNNKLSVTQFVKSQNHVELLSQCNEIVFDNKEIENNPLTTEEVKQCCSDIKVLGRKDLLLLIKWRKSLREEYKKNKKLLLEEEDEVEPVPIEPIQVSDEETEDSKELKRKKKKIQKEKKKLNERMNLKMVLKNDNIEEVDEELFKLHHLRSKKDINKFETFSLSGDENEEEIEVVRKMKKVRFDDKDEKDEEDFDDEDSDIGSNTTEDLVNGSDAEDYIDVDVNENGEDDENDDSGDESGLIVDFAEKESRAMKINRFFEKDIFKNMSDDEELEAMIAEEEGRTKRQSRKAKDDDKYVSSDDGDDEEEEEEKREQKPKTNKERLLAEKCQKEVKLDAESLALAEEMIKSKKARREIIDNAWNRYTHGDEDTLPSWFRKDEEKYNRKPLPVNEEVVEEYKNKMKAINVRPIKKVAEAKARKRKRALRKLEKARKKAESITENSDMSEKEKAAHLRSVYKKFLKKNEKKVTYVVAKKGSSNGRPKGVKGRYKVVDSRMKKDKRAKAGKEKNKKTKHSKGKGFNKNNRRKGSSKR